MINLKRKLDQQSLQGNGSVVRGFTPSLPMTPLSQRIDNAENASDKSRSCISPLRTAANKNTSQKLETLGCLTDSHKSVLEEDLDLESNRPGSQAATTSKKIRRTVSR